MLLSSPSSPSRGSREATYLYPVFGTGGTCLERPRPLLRRPSVSTHPSSGAKSSSHPAASLFLSLSLSCRSCFQGSERPQRLRGARYVRHRRASEWAPIRRPRGPWPGCSSARASVHSGRAPERRDAAVWHRRVRGRRRMNGRALLEDLSGWDGGRVGVEKGNGRARLGRRDCVFEADRRLLVRMRGAARSECGMSVVDKTGPRGMRFARGRPARRLESFWRRGVWALSVPELSPDTVGAGCKGPRGPGGRFGGVIGPCGCTASSPSAVAWPLCADFKRRSRRDRGLSL